MACPKKKNEDRSRWRTQCRQKLSEHIESKLGSYIDPLQVRLITSPDDPYIWSYDPELKHLFEKQISKHTIGAYQELSKWVGSRFEAIPSGSTSAVQVLDHLAGAAKIEQLEQSYRVLEQEHARVLEESKSWETQAVENLRLRLGAEDELAAVRSELNSSNGVIQNLLQQLETLQNTIKTLEGQSASSLHGLNNILRAVEDVRSGLCPVADNNILSNLGFHDICTP